MMMDDRDHNYYSDTNRKIDADMYMTRMKIASQEKIAERELSEKKKQYRISLKITIGVGILGVVGGAFALDIRDLVFQVVNWLKN